jgi:hypothetical protein
MSAPKLTGEPQQFDQLEFSVWGGWSYEPSVELYPSIVDAARVYLARMEGSVDGVRFPCWGDMGPDDYAIADDSFGFTVAELEELVDKAGES